MSNDNRAKKRRRPEIPSLEMKPGEARATLGVVRRISGREPSPPQSDSPTDSTSPSNNTSLAPVTPLAPRRESLPDSESPTDSTVPTLDLWSALTERKDGWLFMPNDIVLVLYRHLDPAEQAVYTQLFQLSWGFGKPHCRVSLPKLAKSAGMKPTATHAAVKRLEAKGVVRKLRPIHGKGVEQGIEYVIPLPDRVAESVRLARSGSLAESADNKRKGFVKDRSKGESLAPETKHPQDCLCLGTGWRDVGGAVKRCEGK